MKLTLQGENKGIIIMVEIEELTARQIEKEIAEIQKVFGVKLIEVTEIKEF